MPAPAAQHEHPARSTRLLVGAAVTIAALGGLALGLHREPPPAGPPAAPVVVSPAVNVNTATAAELRLLPRIGPALSARIIEDREANGPFESLDDLRRVRGIGPRTVEIIRPYAATR